MFILQPQKYLSHFSFIGTLSTSIKRYQKKTQAADLCFLF